MAKQFIEIDEETYKALEEVACKAGVADVSELLERFAADFSNGCSVTLSNGLRVA